MAFELGLITIWDDAVAVHPPDILVAAKAVELAANQGAFFNSLASPAAAITGKNFEIYNRTLTTMNDVIGSGSPAWNIGDTTGLTITADAANKLIIGCVILVENEVVIVKAVDTSANTIDVWSRGAGGTSAATHTGGVAYTVIQYAAHDTDLKNVTSRTETTQKYTNYISQIFETLDYTKSQELIGRDGIGSGGANIDLLKNEAMKRIAITQAIASIRGIKQDGGKSTNPYASAGLLSQLEDTASGTRVILRYNANSAAFSETIFRAALLEAFRKGNPDTAWMSSTNKTIANTFKQSYIQSDARDSQAGYHVDSYDYEGKIIKLRVDQDFVDDKIAIATQRLCQKGWQKGDSLRYVDEPGASSRENRKSLQGSLGYIVEGVGYDHLEIYGIA